MAMNITASQYTFDPAAIDGGKNVMFRVMAGDGLNSAAVDVGPIEIAQTPQITLDKTVLDFGSRAANHVPSQTFTISNPGSGPLMIHTLTVDNPGFHISGGHAPLSVPVGQSRIITVAWAIAGTGPQDGNLTIASTDPSQPSVTVALKGTAVAAVR